MQEVEKILDENMPKSQSTAKTKEEFNFIDKMKKKKESRRLANLRLEKYNKLTQDDIMRYYSDFDKDQKNVEKYIKLKKEGEFDPK